MDADRQVGGVQFLPVSDAPDAVEAMQQFTPGWFVMRLAPRPGQVGITEPTNVFGYDYLFVVGAHVSDDLVARVLAVLSAHEQELVESALVRRMFKAAEMSKPTADLAFHPAAIHLYIETGGWPFKKG